MFGAAELYKHISVLVNWGSRCFVQMAFSFNQNKHGYPSQVVSNGNVVKK